MEHHKHLGCCPSITIDKHPCDALPILLRPFLFIPFFCWCKGTKISAYIQIYVDIQDKKAYFILVGVYLFLHTLYRAMHKGTKMAVNTTPKIGTVNFALASSKLLIQRTNMPI